MKTLTKITALLMAVLMIVSLAACGSPSIVGKWSYTISMTKIMESSMAMAAEGLEDAQKEMYDKYISAFDGCDMIMFLELSEDGVIKMSVDKESLSASLEKVKEKLKEILPAFYASMSGMTLEELKESLEKAGVSLEQYIEQMLASMNTESVTSNMETTEGTYRYEDGKLYIKNSTAEDETCLTVTLTDKELTVTDVAAADADETESSTLVKKELLPMVFTRVS